MSLSVPSFSLGSIEVGGAFLKLMLSFQPTKGDINRFCPNGPCPRFTILAMKKMVYQFCADL